MGEAIPCHDSSCSTQVDEVEEEAARSCGFVAEVEAEVQEYKAALNPSLRYWRETSALVCTLGEPGSFALPERVCFGRGSVVLQADLLCSLLASAHLILRLAKEVFHLLR